MQPYFKKIKPIWIATTFCGLLFIFLLGVRLDFFKKQPPDIISEVTVVPQKEIWMNIFQKDRKIGYTNRRFFQRDDGYYLSESVFMRINTLGMVQDIKIKTFGNLNKDLSLASFNFELKSGMFHFMAHGKVEGKTLTVFIDQQKTEIPLENKIYLTAGIMDAVWSFDLQPDQTRTFYVFDPATMGQRAVQVTMIGYETLNVMGIKQKTKKMSVDFMGVSQTAWIGEDGSVIQEEGFMGIKLKRVTENEALKGMTMAASQDFTSIFAVTPDIPIDQADKLKKLRLKIYGIKNEGFFLNGGRQNFEDGILTILKEDHLDMLEMHLSEKEQFLKPSPFIQSNHPKIKHKVSEIVSPDDSLLSKAKKLMAWMYKNIDKRPVLSVPSALDTLKNLMGDCNEHAVLMAALARAAGIPAQIEAGLVYVKGRFYYHAWNVLYLGEWVTIDSLMGQMPADVTHIRFVRGEPKEQIDLIGVIGKVKLEILEQSK